MIQQHNVCDWEAKGLAWILGGLIQKRGVVWNSIMGYIRRSYPSYRNSTEDMKLIANRLSECATYTYHVLRLQSSETFPTSPLAKIVCDCLECLGIKVIDGHLLNAKISRNIQMSPASSTTIW